MWIYFSPFKYTLMTRVRIVGGTITEKTGGNEIYYAEGNITINAEKK